jgi:integrase
LTKRVHHGECLGKGCCTRIKAFAVFCGLTDYDNKRFRITRKQVTVKAKPKRSLTDDEIEQWYNKFSEWIKAEKQGSVCSLHQWIYAMQATYGFRNHEVLNILNLTEKYLGEDGLWYHPFTDAIANPRGIIYTEGKGVKRSAFLPQPRKWIDDFNLREIPTEYFHFMKEISGLTEYEQEKKKQSKNHTYINFLLKHDFPFTAYNLRHAHNVKSHGLGIPISLIAKNLGHSIQMNQSVYLSSQDLQSCLNAIDQWEANQTNKQNEGISLEAQIELLRQENDRLKSLI